ncbi:MAG: dicarboxylate/amino acid:cation symporter [Gammaproteobacteria bacterium]|nr:dicarboxylate/amino acid:cation symporter [Gammaproteobacteria bacterium]MCW8910221.1 dicarboxylate/amino acid:cation symporter [Gammaproteobacteria bacterium]MCW9005903.1 dicarboxylate/amino acid:cation symporter [Gammaproteobacteria bacterium]
MLKAYLRLQLHWQILIALGLAIVAGLVTGKDAGISGITFYQFYDFFGTLFLNALKMLIVPLIVASIIVGMMGIGSGDRLSRLGGKTLTYYAVTSLLAILTGLVVVNITTPGLVDGTPIKEIIGLSDMTDQTIEKIDGKGAGDIIDVFLRMVPANIVSAAANGQMLGLIFFSLLFGYFLTRINEPQGSVLRNFWQGVLDVMMEITNWVMKFAPIGVFALVAKVVASSGIDVFKPLAVFFFTVLFSLAIHFLVTMPLILKGLAKVSPLRHYKAMSPALLTAFSTSSSSATLPITMDCVEQRAGVSNNVSSFTLPLGATVNMDGTALYECVAAMFIAQAYGLELSFTTQFMIVMIALATSIGVAGIPSASLVAISIILAAIGLPLEAVGLILAVDRVLDMCRTAVNVFSDSVAAVVIGRLEGETEILQKEID